MTMMMQSGRVTRAVAGALQNNLRLLTAPSLQTFKSPDVTNLSMTARNEFRISRFFCNSSKGDAVNDKTSSTVGSNGAEFPKEESNRAETVAKFDHNTDTNSNATAADAKPVTGDAKAPAGAGPKTSEDVKPDPNADLKNLLKEKQAMLKEKDKVLLQAKQQVLTCLAEIENVRGRTRRDAESLKKHAVETFASELLDMADTLGRAAAAIPESVRTEALPADASGNAKLLKSLFEGVDMTEKQLMKIFNKFGVQRFDPVGQRFDPNHHLAIVEVEDESKDPQTVVNVVKPGYVFNDKVIRPAEVSVVKKRAEPQAQ